MKKIVVNLKDESDLYERYNNNISMDLIKYLMKESKYIKDDFKIVVNTKVNVENLDSLIKAGLNKAYNESRIIDKLLDNKQILFFLIGSLFLIISTYIMNDVLNEIIIIIGWVAIWEVVDISLNVDSEQNLNRRLLKKLLRCEIEVNKIGD